MTFRETDKPTTSVPANFTRLGDASGYITAPVENIYRVGTTTIPLSGNIFGNQPANNVTSYQIIDVETGVTTTGGAITAGQPLTLPGGIERGSYRVTFHSGATPSAANYMGGGLFVLADDVAGMPNPPASGGKVALPAMLLICPDRQSIKNAAAPGGEILAAQENVSFLTSHYLAYDTARPKKLFGNFTYFNDGAGQAAGVSQAVSSLPGIDWWEGPNEPPNDGSVLGLGGIPNSSFMTRATAFYNAVKAGRSGAKVLGPCPMSVGGSYLATLEGLFAAGYGNVVDVISWHDYPLTTGDLPLGRKFHEGWIALLTKYGQQDKPRVKSEAGSEAAAEHGLGQPMRQAYRLMLDIMLSEQYGVPKENYVLFTPLDAEHPYWISAIAGQPYPFVLAMMTHSQMLLGTTWEARHDFGTVDNLSIIGSSYRRADETATVSVMTAGRPTAQVTYQVTGGTPTSIVGRDWRHRSTSIPVVGGKVTVNPYQMPKYLELPAGVTLTPIDGDTRYGTRRSAGATPTSSTGSRGLSSLRNVLDGPYKNPPDWRNRLYFDSDNVGDGISVWQAKDILTTPQTVTVTFPTAVPIDTMYVHCPPAWQQLAVIKDAVVEVWDGDSWEATDAVIDENYDVRELPANSQDSFNSYAEVFGFMPNVWELTFDRVTTTAVRLKVSAISAGGVPDVTTLNAFGATAEAGYAVSIGMGTEYPMLALQHLAVFDSEAEDVTPDNPDDLNPVRYVVLASGA